MGWFILCRAVLVRVLFATHGLVSILLLHLATNNPVYWCIASAVVGLLAETVFTLKLKRGQEYKWCCPSVIFYLSCVVPAIWFLELHQLEMRIKQHTTRNDSSAPSACEYSDYLPTTETNTGLFKINDERVRILEQVLLLLLILGRWVLPKGKLTHDQLSQLLLVYIGTAGDIVEFFEAFKEKEVKCHRTLCVIILSIWSWSLLQFTMVLTATKARKDKSGLLAARYDHPRRGILSCCTPDVYGIIISICLQDGPFLVLRLLLIFKYDVLSYTNAFFTCKNSLVCALLLYRLIIVQIERRHPSFFAKSTSSGGLSSHSEWILRESASGARLIAKSSSTVAAAAAAGEYYKYKTTVQLAERGLDEDDVIDVDYVIKRHFSLEEGRGVIENEAAVDYVILRQYGAENRGVTADREALGCVVRENALARDDDTDDEYIESPSRQPQVTTC